MKICQKNRKSTLSLQTILKNGHLEGKAYGKSKKNSNSNSKKKTEIGPKKT